MGRFIFLLGNFSNGCKLFYRVNTRMLNLSAQVAQLNNIISLTYASLKLKSVLLSERL
jgi:hypothetical protein